MSKGAILFSPGPFGGAEKLILDSSKELNLPLILIEESRNPIHAKEFEARLREAQIAYTKMISHRRFDKELIRELQRYLTDHKIQFIHSHGLKANFINSYLSVNKIATQHGQTSHTLKMKLMELVENYRLAQMDKVIFVSQKMYEASKLKNKTLVENYIPEHEYHSFSFSKESSFKIAFAGRLSPEKGVEFLINSLSDQTHGELHIFGEGELKHFVEQNTSPNIIYHGFCTDIISQLKEMHLLIIPSQREGLPLVALDAISLGMPVLATKVGGLPKLIGNEKYLFNYGDKQALNDKIAFVINSYNHAVQDFQIIRTKVVKDYSKDLWLKKMKSLYDRL